MKNHNIYIYICINKLSKGEENNIRTAYTSTRLLKKKNIEVCFAFIVFMINLANLERNYQILSLSFKFKLIKQNDSIIYICCFQQAKKKKKHFFFSEE